MTFNFSTQNVVEWFKVKVYTTTKFALVNVLNLLSKSAAYRIPHLNVEHIDLLFKKIFVRKT